MNEVEPCNSLEPPSSIHSLRCEAAWNLVKDVDPNAAMTELFSPLHAIMPK
jgi:hypothetical protein